MRAADLTPEDVADRIQALGHTLFTAPGDPTVFGIRAHTRDSDAWDDVLGVLWHEGRILHGLLAQGTTDPGRPGLLEPSNRAGTAIVLPGQHRGCWSVGRPQDRGNRAHPYPCFRQVGRIAHIRDVDRDAVLDIGTTGYAQDPQGWADAYTAITLGRQVHEEIIYADGHHASSTRLADAVGPWSLACQVWRRLSDWEAAYGQVLAAVPAWGHRHSYCLLDEWGMG